MSAICGGNREEEWKYINKSKTGEEYIKRIEECFMAIM